MTDKRIKKGNDIIAASNFVSIFMTVLLIILGLVLVILGATHKTAYITSSGSIAYKSEPSAGMIIGGIASWISIVFVWTIIKPLIHGYGLIVSASEVYLSEHNVKNNLDNNKTNYENINKKKTVDNKVVKKEEGN